MAHTIHNPAAEAIMNVLSLEGDLSPSEEVNNAFTELVLLAQSLDYELMAINLSDIPENHLTELRRRCSIAEGLLEMYWAVKIVNNAMTIEDFPYYQNYLDLCEWEYQAIMSLENNISECRLNFIGGGPLPLTSIIMAQKYGLKSKIIDVDDNAVEIANSVIEVLGLSHMISFELASGEEYKGIEKNDVVYIAALAGLNSDDKSKIMDNVRNQISNDQIVLFRGAHSGRKILYLDVTEKDLEINGFEQVLRIDPFTDIINSIVIARKFINEN